MNRFGVHRKKGVLKKMKQLHDINTFFPQDLRTPSTEEKRRALVSLVFFKEKSTGEVKGCTCVNGALQREYI